MDLEEFFFSFIQKDFDNKFDDTCISFDVK